MKKIGQPYIIYKPLKLAIITAKRNTVTVIYYATEISDQSEEQNLERRQEQDTNSDPNSIQQLVTNTHYESGDVI